MSGIQGTFNTAAQGMNTQAQAMSVISTNIVNVNTNSYKAEDNHFETILNHLLPNNQAFFAVKNMNSRDVDRQGQITTTNRTMDLALNGKGFIVTNTGQGATGIWEYTRDGSFYGKSVTLSTSTNGNGQLDQGTLLTTSNGNYVYGWPANADGTFTETNNLSSLVPIQYASDSIYPAQPTTTISLQANLSAGSTGRQTVSLPYVNADGTSQSLNLGFSGDLTTGWTIDGSTSSGSTVDLNPPNVAFDGFGKLVSPTDGKIQVTINDPSGPQVVSLDLSNMTSLADKGGIVVQQVNQDGFISGRLQNTYFTSDGTLVGSYSNFQVKPLFKLPIANFLNNDGLQALPGNVYTQTDTSGALTLSGLGISPVGTQFVTGALERSTVDLSDQFAKMIVTQRAYSSSAKVLTVADEMTQAVRDLKR